MRFLKRKACMLLGTVALVSVFSACKKEDPYSVTPLKNVVELTVEDPDLDLLEAAVVKAGLATALADLTKQYTVFAPSDAAFVAYLGSQTAGAIKDEAGAKAAIEAITATSTPIDLNLLKKILQYHVLTTAIASGSIQTKDNVETSTLSTDKMYISKKSATEISVNGAKVTKADIGSSNGSNGIIHIMDKVILPVTGDIVATATAAPNLKLLVAAIKRAELVTTLQGSGPFTVFAPTDDAFKAAGYDSEAKINAATKEALAKILTYHVVPTSRAYSSLLTAGDVTTVQGGKVTVALTGGVTVKGAQNPSPAKVSLADITATNGVVHVVDTVLLPN